MPDREMFERERDRSERERERWPEREGKGNEENWRNNRAEEHSRTQADRGAAERGWAGSRGDWGDWREQQSNRSYGDYGRDTYGSRGQQEFRDREEQWNRGSGSQGSGPYQSFQRGGADSEGGRGHERSVGSQRDFGHRGGGTGTRETERWGNQFERGSYGAGSLGQSSGWSGGMGTYSQTGGGQFSGRGPKGWRRSDDRIREDVNERLTQHPDIDATELDVQVSECEVTLSGSVDTRYAKRLAEDIAEGVSGVREVNNQIRIVRSDSGSADR